MSGVPESEKVEAPRMWIREAPPTMPVEERTVTPGTRPFSTCDTSTTGAFTMMSAALTVETTLPSAFFCVAPGVPVTTISLREIADGLSSNLRFMSPGRASIVASA